MEEDMYDLVCYMATSAKSLMDEPRHYATARMMDSLGRLLRLIDEEDISKELLNKIEGNDFFSRNREEVEAALDEIIDELLKYE
ncbi:MAG: DUF6092 family protein [Candidatus Saliniplasma sp.]